MGRLDTVTFAGASGSKYDFDVYPRDTQFEAIGAVYFFTKSEKNQDGYSHKKIYVGETHDLSGSFDNHRAMPCIEEYGMDCICIHAEPNILQREMIERDLVLASRPICNNVLGGGPGVGKWIF